MTDNGGVKITISANVAITDAKVCIPQCMRDPQTGYNNDVGSPQVCSNTVTITAVIENTGFPGALSSVSYNWLVNGSGSGTGNGGIEQVGSPTPVIPVPGDPSKLTTSITVKSKASNWNWTPGSVGFSYQVPPVPIFCPGDPINPISTCPGFSGAGPTLIVYKDGTYPPVEGTDEVIMGPKCVKIGDIVSFTVYPRFTWVPTAFPDSYQWNVNETNSSSTFPFGLGWLPGLKVLYWSGDRSSVTVLVEQNFAGGNLNVVAGTANSCNDDIYTLELGLTPTKFKILANKIDGVVQNPPVSSTCIPMDASNHTFEFQIVSDEVFTSGPLVGQPRPIVEGTYSWTHSDGFNLIFSNSTGTLANFSTFTNSDCPRGYAGSVSASITTNCPAPLTKHSANFPIGRSFTDQVIITDPDAAQLCIDDLGERYDFFINNISCGANISWTPPPLGWYTHTPMAAPLSTPGSSWSGHVAVPSAINGLSQVLTASDGCGHTLTSNPLIVSWTDLDVLLELIPFASGVTKCPEFTAQLVNLPEGCCSDRFEFIWTHSRGDEAFCDRRNPSGCGQNRISVLEPGLISLTVKSCAYNPCRTCIRSERYTWLIRDNTESREWFTACRQSNGRCPTITRQCEPLVVHEEETHNSNKNARSAVAPEKPNEIGLQVVPNPAGKSFAIQLDEPVENAEYQLQDLYGKTVLSGKISGSTAQVRVSKLSRGTYILKVSTEKGLFSKSVILE